MEERREKKLLKLQEILSKNFYENEFAGCFKDGNIEKKVKIMQIDEVNISDNANVSERREMLKDGDIISI